MSAQLTERQSLTVSRTRQRGRNALVPGREPRLPEPAQLYGLVVQAFMVHVPEGAIGGDTGCAECPEPWPCGRLRLAYRLREGF
jgi:hypothetical protein